MHARSAFIIYPGIYSANFVLEIPSHTLPCHLTDNITYFTPPLPISIDLSSVCLSPAWCTCEISNVLLAGGQVVSFVIATLACIQNKNISGLFNPKHVRLQKILTEGVHLLQRFLSDKGREDPKSAKSGSSSALQRNAILHQ